MEQEEGGIKVALNIFHTGDLHIGMKFSNYGESIRTKLQEARFTSLENMVNQSNDLGSDIFVVAGDLFNTTQVAKRDIERTVRILDKFSGACVIVMPGNHDYDNGMVDLWKDFNKVANEKIVYMWEKKPYYLDNYDLDVVVYPAPCHAKHSSENSLGWIKEEGLEEDGKYHIGIAHGALEGLSPDLVGNYYYMDKSELENIPVDVWLLGHTHVSYPENERVVGWKVFNAGTHEPDGLDCRNEGSAWNIIIDEDKKVTGERVITGTYRFYDKSFEITRDEELEEISNWVLEEDPLKKIIRLSLEGRVSSNLYGELNIFYGELEKKLLHLIVDDSKLRTRINQETIEKEFTQGSFPHLFLNDLIHDDEALQIAYDLIKEG